MLYLNQFLWFQMTSSDFKHFIKYSYNLHDSYNLHNSEDEVNV